MSVREPRVGDIVEHIISDRRVRITAAWPHPGISGTWLFVGDDGNTRPYRSDFWRVIDPPEDTGAGEGGL